MLYALTLYSPKTVKGANQHQSHVYQSDNPLEFDSKAVARLEAHAPEIFQGENGQWYISSAEWPERGVSIAKLKWE
jgi:arabinan endo-1,5-alpha-L-arabinosidase